MSKRIHELAKEWNVPPKDLIAGLEKVGIRGRRSQSSLTDDEVQQAREAPAARTAPEPAPEHVPAPEAPAAMAAAPAAAPAPVRPVARPAAAPAAAPPPGFEEMRGVKVLGKIDLRKPAASAPSPGSRPGEGAAPP